MFMDDEWVCSFVKTLPSLVNNLWWNIIMDDGNVDKNSLGKWQQLQQCKYVIIQKNYKEHK